MNKVDFDPIEPDVLARFTDDQWRAWQYANMVFYEKLSALADVADIAFRACSCDYPEGLEKRFEGLSLILRDDLERLKDNFDDVEQLVLDAKERKL